jgi:hypothetical protein
MCIAAIVAAPTPAQAVPTCQGAARSQAHNPTDRVQLDCHGRGRLWLVVSHPDDRTDQALIAARNIGPNSHGVWQLTARSGTSTSRAAGTRTADEHEAGRAVP